jgi:hypothetical protein
VKLLFIGDVVGSPGRRGLAAAMPDLQDRFDPDLVVVNGENSAGGMGITPKTAEEIFALGVDVITLGNHSYRHRDAYEYLDETERVIRPANYRRGNPGHGSVVVEAAGIRVAVVNLSGTVGLRAARSPFDEADLLVDRLEDWANGFFFYRYECQLWHRETGRLVGNAYGSCNSREGKYRWRNVPEWKATAEEKKNALRVETKTNNRGEYAVYVDGLVVALACDNQLFLKPTPATAARLATAPMAPPYPGAKPHALIDEWLDDPEALAALLS